ncbi:ABC transporter ATP-binding protein [Corynebacterium macginleyi]|uniref:ABC transporter ATP-binding protein n=1 Tax=Corynebacterium macginleyi TaxID=38290 RepID=UPI000EF9A212|nr:ATP-binding cassette domain-containing protein [Corynebacterium macginleyi]MBK4160984.1 ATP-binding cassette domain-containing protein [Corynebacterium macginleyi]MBK4180054.1 ATP-binding cassette domain-containing protein [Corynebacterium macginleyi]MBK4182410.1 ATP-binding cassette domain-containing protein [Corynebacterium macginleyi]QRJ59668.1 ATP-binding cassette domain-containing protein [Corynebacterium macginleyi]QRP21003.1 ATP-binding cassette domain-containing protein [Corynebacte
MLTVDASIGYTTVLCSLNQVFLTGRLYGIVGKNGSGKSSLLRTISGETYPLEGKVLLNDIDTWSTKLIGKIIYISSPTFYPDMSVGEHIKLLEKTQKISYSKTVEAWGLSDLLELSPSMLSSGQQQRFSLAIQLAMEKAQVLLLDEPERHLDDFWVERLCRVLERKALEGATVIIASHSEKILNQCNTKINLS